ncbi:MAG: TonB-dependent receptor [Pseudomonadales bacterium]
MQPGSICLMLFVCSGATAAPPPTIEELIVTGEADKRTFELARTVDIAPDSALLLRKAVGANVESNGPITGIVQYRGMSRSRVSSHIDGAVISPGGPNWMDPPLSYAPAAHLDSLDVYRGIAPVSAGQETIGGVVHANTWSGDFAAAGATIDARARTGLQSVNDGTLVSAAVVLATPGQRFKLSGLTEEADDAEFADGRILPSEYRRDRYDLGYSVRRGAHTVRVDYGRNETGDAGTAALPMDIQYIDADLYRLGYEFAGERYTVSGRAYRSDIGHGMSNYHLRTPPASPAMYRRNLAAAQSRGFALELALDGWTLGIDGHAERHDSDIDNPNNPMFFVTNFNDAERQILGAYAERQFGFDNGVNVELGARLNRVHMDANEVDATPALTGMAPAVALRQAFNDADRSRTDRNVDWTVKAYLPLADRTVLYAGLARKSRSPSYQERYLWLPLEATAGLADFRTYTGSVDLDPEVAHEVELGFDWESDRARIAPRLFYRYVDDYIQGTPSGNGAALVFVSMMNMMNGTSSPPPLEFNNVDAALYGVDLDWRYQVSERWSLDGVVNLIRGEREDIDDDLYRMAPANAFVAVNYQRAAWGLSLETFAYADQNKISATNGELSSDGYVVFNLKGHWQLTDQFKLGFGVDNLLDSDFEDHLAGINRVMGNPDLAVGERMPGLGRNLFARLDFNW